MTSKKEERVSKVLRELEQIAIREHLPSIGPIEGKIILEKTNLQQYLRLEPCMDILQY